MEDNRIVVGRMEPRERLDWDIRAKTKRNRQNIQPLRNTVILAAVSLFTIIGGWAAISGLEPVRMAMNHVTAGFEYDETLGRLQFVSNILPESAMVFLQSGIQQPLHVVAGQAAESHSWSLNEPWIEYACIGDVSACQDGEVITVVQNHMKDYTVRVLHDNGCESIYSGLSAVQVHENDSVVAGQQVGTAAGSAAFEWREGGISVQPVFGALIE